jgi:hypothetical protein
MEALVASGDKTFTEAIRGKVVDRIILNNDQEELSLEVVFMDTTSFNVRLAPSLIQVLGVDVLGWKDGNSFVIKELL